MSNTIKTNKIMEAQKVKISEVKPNPSNPRLIKDQKFEKLVKSIQEFPQMLELRPIVVNEEMIVLGGNMRLRACEAAGLKEVPIVIANELTPEQQKEFIIKDNLGFGEWDWDMIADEWNEHELIEWGMEIPGFDLEGNFKEEQPYNWQNKVAIEFNSTEEAQAYFEKVTKEGLKAKLS